ncbi:small acid-soluble spore protein Tlp [Dehalobacter sp. DCM]|uniref:small acid-soluble spore protein Tlp n=1 Tax=Dehalobacter sp. DCM TaxID=2907827 RepID=UPI0030820C28|nr:small acid-soluble spore protein Tlp [Dehalobacter sp. DCM]
MKSKPDDRRDNVDRIQKNINHTIQNMELADEMIARTDDPKSKEDLEAKNDRRQDALDNMRAEIRDEALDKKRGYQN